MAGCALVAATRESATTKKSVSFISSPPSDDRMIKRVRSSRQWDLIRATTREWQIHLRTTRAVTDEVILGLLHSLVRRAGLGVRFSWRFALSCFLRNRSSAFVQAVLISVKSVVHPW